MLAGKLFETPADTYEVGPKVTPRKWKMVEGGKKNLERLGNIFAYVLLLKSILILAKSLSLSKGLVR